MSDTAITNMTSVFAKYMMPGPRKLRTASRSFVARERRSPTFQRRYVSAGSRATWAKRSFRSSYSIVRDARMIVMRIRKRKIPCSVTARRMSPASPRTAPFVIPCWR